ncbi:hypothetical protein TorRG33x02_187180 [Trema orientale]|uniref:Uncharacterized protein n=1 Tax=Trema orientale TaxID=63057 RepID=A0A2P5EIQ9_TREOI|nr:hypothetical protein TorRG33x02_187180 [Trema orientale]
MESVAAFGQSPAHIAVFEPGQTDDALGPIKPIAGAGGLVDEERDGGYGGGFEALGVVLGGGGGEVEAERRSREGVETGRRAEDAGDGGDGAVAAAVGVGQEPLGVDVEEQDEDDDEEQGDEGGQHYVAVVGENALHEVTQRVVVIGRVGLSRRRRRVTVTGAHYWQRREESDNE